jgi:hypothetical protein
MNNNSVYNQNLRVLTTKTIEKIQRFEYASIVKARDFWEQEKQNANDMELFNQLIDINIIEEVNTIIYSYFMRKGQPEDANQAMNWRQNFSHRQLFKMFLSEITSSVVDVSNCDNVLTSRLTKIETEILYTPGLSMAMGKIINEAIRESGWLDSINNGMGQMVPNPRNIPLITEFLKRFGVNTCGKQNSKRS